MPPEPLPWDRKNFFKDRRHERPETSFLGSTPRWRDSYSSPYGSSREFAPWGGSNDFRRPFGHGKQGAWHLFAEESGHGYLPSRSGDKMLECENGRPSVSRGDGKCSRNNRENRWLYGQRDWKCHSWEVSNGSPNTAWRLHDVINDQRSVDDMLTPVPSHPPHSDFVNTWDQNHMKDQHDNNNVGGVNGLGTGQRGDRENSLDWKTLKWTRSGSLSSRGSGFSHSSSSKSLGGVDSNEVKPELQLKRAKPVQSPSGDTAANAMPALPYEEMISRKKPRLNWGEGLAKYERKKVEGPEVPVNKDGAVVSTCNAEPMHPQISNLADKSPRTTVLSDCASPATPSSVGCSSSLGIEEKTFCKTLNVDNGASNLCATPSTESQSHLEASSFHLEKLDICSVPNLCSSVFELLQSDDPSSLDLSFVRSSAMNELLVRKVDILKALETTEFEIDLLENEFKSMKYESGSGCTCLAASNSVLEEGNAKPCSEQGSASMIPRPSPLQVASCGNEIVEKIPLCNGTLVEAHGGDIYSPGTATSNFVESLTLENVVSSSDMVKHGECSGDRDAIQSTSIELKRSESHVNEEEATVFTCRDVSMHEESKDDGPFSGDVKLHKDGEDNSCNPILASNKESAKKAFEVFSKLLPGDQCKIDFSGKIPSLQGDALFKEKFAMRKRRLRFKERIVTLKFKAFQHLWKEDMRLLSIRKHRAKSQKKCELGLRTMHNGYQKHQSSIRSRFSSPAGNLILVPSSATLDFSSKLLSDLQIKFYGNALKMPSLILDEKEKTILRFISSNGLVEDPCAFENEKAMINPWTLEEREIFMDKLAAFGKDFHKIASFLDHKTTADCVEFYYKNHKSDCFVKTKTKQAKSSSSYLVASGRKWNREMNAASLDILGEASLMATDADNTMASRQRSSGRISLGGYRDSKMSQGDGDILERSSNFDGLGNDRETAAAADVLVGICGSVSSEAMSSCITTCVDPGEIYRECTLRKVDSVVKGHSVSDFMQNVDDETCSDESCGEMDPTSWTDEEKSVFIQAVSSYGKDFSMISRCVRTRSRNQCKVFFSKARKCLGLDLIHHRPRNLGTPVSDDANGGESDLEDACAVETANDKMDENLPLSANVKQEASHDEEKISLHGVLNRSADNSVKGLLGQNDPKFVETLVSDECHMEYKPELASDVDSKIINGFIQQSESVEDQKVSIEFVSVETEREHVTEEGISISGSISVGDGVDLVSSSPSAVVDVKPVAEFSALQNRLEGQETVFPESSLSSQSGLVQDSNTSRSASHLPGDTDSCSNFNFGVENTYQASVELESVVKPPPAVLLRSQNVVTSKNMLQDSTSVQCEKLHNQEQLPSALDVQKSRDKQGQKSVSRDDHFQLLSEWTYMKQNESSQILRGYPLPIPTKKEMSGDISCGSFSDVQSHLNSERKVSSQFMAQGCFVQNCNNPKAQCSVPEIPLASQHNEKAIDHPRDRSRSLSDTEKPIRNGDVKLFGKILNNPLSLQSDSSNHENDEKGGNHPNLSSKSSTLKFAGRHNKDVNAAPLKFDGNNYLGIENVPTLSYGFWDGIRKQTGFSSFSDSAILLAKYPAAFSNYQATSSKIHQQALQAVVKRNERIGVSVFPPREISGSNGVVDYQMCGSCDGAKVQPFSVDMKQWPDILSEIQGRKRVESISSLQQQGRGIVGMNVGGRGGILAGGPCTTGVSDPVAAIKMHFAKTDRFAGETGTTGIREDESWRGNGDIGR